MKYNYFILKASTSYMYQCLILVIMAFSRLFAIGVCPQHCSCSPSMIPGMNQTSINVVCSSFNIPNIPNGLHPDTGLLSIMGSQSNRFSISHLLTRDLKPLTNLHHLTITFTELKFIEEDAFLDLQNLKIIDLSNNKLVKIFPNTFSFAQKLVFVSLSSNRGLEIPERTFWYLRELKELYLSGTSLIDIRPSVFYGLTGLRQLDLSSNNISTFSPELVLQFPNLWSLDISFNELTTLNANITLFSPNLKRLNLDGNAWHCNCQLKWLKQYPHLINEHRSDPLICSYPENLKFISLSQIEPGKLVCKPPIIKNCPTHMHVFEGDELIIHCTISGDPFPSSSNITWKLPNGAISLSALLSTSNESEKIALFETQNIQEPMQGDFTLIAISEFGQATHKINVVVQKLTTTTTPSSTISTTSSGNTFSKSFTPITHSKTRKLISTPTWQKQVTTTSAKLFQTSTILPPNTRLLQPHPLTTTKIPQNKKSNNDRDQTHIPNGGQNNNYNQFSAQTSNQNQEIVPIIVASVMSTITAMLIGLIAVYVIRKWCKERDKNSSQSRGRPNTRSTSAGGDNSFIPNAPLYTGYKNYNGDFTGHILRMKNKNEEETRFYNSADEVTHPQLRMLKTSLPPVPNTATSGNKYDTYSGPMPKYDVYSSNGSLESRSETPIVVKRTTPTPSPTNQEVLSNSHTSINHIGKNKVSNSNDLYSISKIQSPEDEQSRSSIPSIHVSTPDSVTHSATSNTIVAAKGLGNTSIFEIDNTDRCPTPVPPPRDSKNLSDIKHSPKLKNSLLLKRSSLPDPLQTFEMQ